jgi:hypothetical protein
MSWSTLRRRVLSHSWSGCLRSSTLRSCSGRHPRRSTSRTASSSTACALALMTYPSSGSSSRARIRIISKHLTHYPGLRLMVTHILAQTTGRLTRTQSGRERERIRPLSIGYRSKCLSRTPRIWCTLSFLWNTLELLRKRSSIAFWS